MIRNGSRRRWRKLRREVLERDGYRCRDCGRAGKLEVHHVIPVREAPALEFVRGNLRSLCRGCHIARHRRKRTRAEAAWGRHLDGFL